ncbi:MAG TPA: glycoside hydrolase family 15 protein, partial [Tepidisphaeraceae bacterium]|nr:glycoside hydrolase family 15 protein [Tepidisphaeraceae bacterium]
MGANNQSDSNQSKAIHWAPGRPGSKPTWSPAAKSGVGTALSSGSRLWFTLGRGIINEIYHPRIDHAAVGDMEFLVSGPGGFFSEEKRDTSSNTICLTKGVPAYRLENRCVQGKYWLAKEIIVDPDRDVLLQRVRFTPLQGEANSLRLFSLLSPRLGNQGADNTGWVGSYRGRPMLMAQHDSHCLAIASSTPWSNRSVGFVGVSDAWQDVRTHGQMMWSYDRAEHGHIALAGEIDLQRCGGEFVLAISLDQTPAAAALNASLSLRNSFDAIRDRYIAQWTKWQSTLEPLEPANQSEGDQSASIRHSRPDQSRPRVGGEGAPAPGGLYRASTMALRVHRSIHIAGAGIASLAIPWGETRGDDEAGYHLVWPRDLVEEAFGFLAAGEHNEAQAAVAYLAATQKSGEKEGGWPQNMWLDGQSHSPGVQLDEAALPVLLLDQAERESVLSEEQARAYWPMVRRAARFLISRGPSTGQDRWENKSGLSPFTLATEIAALLVGARMAERIGEGKTSQYLRQTADLWNDFLEEWTYVEGTGLANRIGVPGYYVRIAPSPGINQAGDVQSKETVSPDALALVRFGLRAADDPRIANTVKVIDAVNCIETPAGPCWHRYNGDQYGEHDDGKPPADQDKGHGRAWPLLTGERGHFELAAGNIEQARRMLRTMEGFASQIGLLPEQIWDGDDLPARGLYLGRPTGSAMPLAWTHSEYIRLLRSIRDGKVFDRPDDTWDRYVKNRTGSDLALWRFDHRANSFPAGRKLRIELLLPAMVRFSTTRWKSASNLTTQDTGMGTHIVDLPSAQLGVGDEVDFTFQWPLAGNRWEEQNYRVAAVKSRQPSQSG